MIVGVEVVDLNTPVPVLVTEPLKLIVVVTEANPASKVAPLEIEILPVVNSVDVLETEPVQVKFPPLIVVSPVTIKDFNPEDDDLLIKNLPPDNVKFPLTVNVLFELSDKKCGALLIVDEEKKLLGIFTDGDLRRALQIKGPSVLEQSMRDLMTDSTIVANREQLAWDALALMQRDPKKYITTLPVVLNDRTVIGVLRLHDIIQAGIA